MGSSDLTLVCPVRPGESNEPLRYMLRSVAAHLPEARVILAGHKPAWVQGVEHVPVPQPRPDRSNVARILAAVCAHPSTPSEFMLVNDDFFAMVPNPPVPMVHNGTLADLAGEPGWRHGWYARALANTRGVLAEWGHESPLSYDRVHQPMPVVTEVMGEVLDAAGDVPVLHRSLYGNTVGGGEAGVDAKARAAEPLQDLPWASTAPSSWNRQAGRAVRKAFPDPCRYET